MWHLTPDTWHLTCDTWHLTCDMWHMVGCEHSQKCQPPSFNTLGFMISWRLQGKGWINELMSARGDCRTALAKPSLLNSVDNLKMKVQFATRPKRYCQS